MALNGFGKKKKIKFKSDKYFYCNGLRLGFQQALKFAGGETALDIGAGFGNEVKVLLNKGYSVTAVEPNLEAANYLNKLAGKRSNNLKVLEQSLPNLNINNKFDFVICEMVLHFLDKKDVMSSVKNIQSYTNVGA